MIYVRMMSLVVYKLLSGKKQAGSHQVWLVWCTRNQYPGWCQLAWRSHRSSLPVMERQLPLSWDVAPLLSPCRCLSKGRGHASPLTAHPLPALPGDALYSTSAADSSSDEEHRQVSSWMHFPRRGTKAIPSTPAVSLPFLSVLWLLRICTACSSAYTMCEC